jgi:hypothetical protein
VPDHEPLDIASLDTDPGDRPEARAARDEGTTPRGTDSPEAMDSDPPTDAAAAASEPMVLERLPESVDPTPPGRQRTGDPPATR